MRLHVASSCRRLLRVARASEFAICVLVLLALSAVIVPKFTQASDPSRERMLADLLRYMRTQVQVYQNQHGGRSPGVPADQSALVSDAATFVAQMTRYTDRVGNVVPVNDRNCVYGPYLPAISANPFTLQNGVLIVPGAAFPPPDDSQPYGWMFSPSTGRLLANVEGVGPDGLPYADY